MENRRNACSIRQRHPFGNAVRDERQLSNEKDGIPRLVENQIIIRGAPVVARSLTAVGTAAMAAGIHMRSRPVKTKKFLHVTAADRKGILKFEHGEKWKKAWRQEKKTTRHYRSGLHTPQVDIQERRVARRNRARQARRGVVLRGAGTVAMTAGALTPMLAYGYVASRYVTTPFEYQFEGEKQMVKTGQIAADAAYMGTMMSNNLLTAVSTVRMGFHVGKTLLSGIDEIV